MQDTKAAQEVSALAAFYAMLGQDSARAFYGPGHVRAAADLGAVQTLLLSDTLFRVNDVAKVKFRPLLQLLASLSIANCPLASNMLPHLSPQCSQDRA